MADPRKRPSSESPTRLLNQDAADASTSAAEDLPRPGPIISGTLLVVLRALAAIIWWIGFARAWPEPILGTGIDKDPEGSRLILSIMLAGGGIWTLLLLLLALFVWRGSNTARVLTMVWMTLSITIAALDYITSGAQLMIRTTLLTLAFDILVLLALSSKTARIWARRPRRRRARTQHRSLTSTGH